MSNNCIWSILSIGELNFVNTSSLYDNHLLKGRSLYQLIHPEEVALARRDLTIFMNSNVLGGSVTRCRLKDYTKINTNVWLVVDIIMYMATKDLVLAFFHYQPQPNQACSNHLFEIESRNIISLLKDSLMESSTRSPSLSSTNTSLSSQSSHLEEGLPDQFFHIIDNHSKSVLLSWPDQYYYPNKEFLLDNRPMSLTISCFRCVRQAARTTSLGEKVHQILIDYGSITFVLVYIEKKPKTPTMQRLSPPLSSPIHKKRPYLPPVNNSNKQQQYPFTSNQRNQCHSCGTDSSPEWRRGPTGHKTLCNACGLRYSRSVARQGKNQKHLFQKTPYQYPSSSTSSPSSSSLTKKHYKQSIQFTIS